MYQNVVFKYLFKNLEMQEFDKNVIMSSTYK
jgi:hypothetical protein